MASITETETVVKRILPYLERRGYGIGDLTFELATTDQPTKKFIDIAVNAGHKKPQFLVEAKRKSHRLVQADRTQAIKYGKSVGVPFVVVTNGVDLELWNTSTSEQIQLVSAKGGQMMVPHRSKLAKTMKRFRDIPSTSNLNEQDESLPFRPGLPLKQLNALFARCHSKIRTLEKDEDNAFSDFSKLLFLRLLEEKSDAALGDVTETFKLPYSTRFHELAAMPPANNDQVRSLVDTAIDNCRQQYGEVITSGLHIKQPATYKYLVTELSKVSFTDSGLDTKGAAFEYFVRATLKGKKLGQYFTPRQLVELMLEMVGRRLIVGSTMSGEPLKVIDPACGTGGFLVFLMKDALAQIDAGVAERDYSVDSGKKAKKLIKEETFYGIDANAGVASSAKMNMIISGDGHTNIGHANSLSKDAPFWSLDSPEYDLVISNPPFGTSESDLPADDLADFPVKTSKGQLLFLQKMVRSAKVGGYVCTVIDDGALNTESAAPVREWLLRNVKMKGIVSLPSVTFKPNKITVKSSVLFMERIDPKASDHEEDEYQIPFVQLQTLGFAPSGEALRGFNFEDLKKDFRSLFRAGLTAPIDGVGWRAFPVSSQEVAADEHYRLDLKYWDPEIIVTIEAMKAAGGKTIKELNLIDTDRGKSPSAALYVDREDGYAMVLKAGSSVSSFGEIIDNGDWIEKSLFDDMPARSIVQKSDVLLSSTGDGTLGKSALYGLKDPAVADGHITIIRVDKKKVDPQFLSDYLREGFGRVQSNRLYTGSTGLIELTPDAVQTIVVPTYMSLAEQKQASKRLRSAESKASAQIEKGQCTLMGSRNEFAGHNLGDAASEGV
ncbi:N-6 DNA methylase [Arthrobacter sp.]|uniref:N-6 DNA methylase n=1 Tax=Arthrobacter sp. TaxID=1667 RepID=UPI003A8E3F8D